MNLYTLILPKTFPQPSGKYVNYILHFKNKHIFYKKLLFLNQFYSNCLKTTIGF